MRYSRTIAPPACLQRTLICFKLRLRTRFFTAQMADHLEVPNYRHSLVLVSNIMVDVHKSYFSLAGFIKLRNNAMTQNSNRQKVSYLYRKLNRLRTHSCRYALTVISARLGSNDRYSHVYHRLSSLSGHDTPRADVGAPVLVLHRLQPAPDGVAQRTRPLWDPLCR